MVPITWTAILCLISLTDPKYVLPIIAALLKEVVLMANSAYY